jgi:hypothetical protein
VYKYSSTFIVPLVFWTLNYSCSYNYSVPDPDGKRVVVSVFLGSHGSYHKYIEEGNTPSSCVIAALFLSGKTKWDLLDSLIRRVFKVQQISV